MIKQIYMYIYISHTLRFYLVQAMMQVTFIPASEIFLTTTRNCMEAFGNGLKKNWLKRTSHTRLKKKKRETEDLLTALPSKSESIWDKARVSRLYIPSLLLCAWCSKIVGLGLYMMLISIACFNKASFYSKFFI